MQRDKPTKRKTKKLMIPNGEDKAKNRENEANTK